MYIMLTNIVDKTILKREKVILKQEVIRDKKEYQNISKGSKGSIKQVVAIQFFSTNIASKYIQQK